MLDSCRITGSGDWHLLAVAVAGDAEISRLDSGRNDSRWWRNRNARLFFYSGGSRIRAVASGCILGRRGCGFGHIIFNRVMGSAGGIELDGICAVSATQQAKR